MTPEDKWQRHLEVCKRYRERNREKCRAATRASEAKYPERKRASQKRWAKNNPVKVLEKGRRHERINREKRRAKSRNYMRRRRLDNPEAVRQAERARYAMEKKSAHSKWKRQTKKRKEWRRNNPKLAREQARRKRIEHPETARAGSVNRKARFKQAEGRHTGKDIKALYELQGKRCAAPWCRCEIVPKTYHVDHIMPLVLGGSNWPGNLQLLCRRCNLEKCAKHPDDWYQEHTGRPMPPGLKTDYPFTG